MTGILKHYSKRHTILRHMASAVMLISCSSASAAVPGEGRYINLKNNLAETCEMAQGRFTSSWDCQCPTAWNGKPMTFNADTLQCEETERFNFSCKDETDSKMRICLFNFARNSAMRINLNIDPEHYPAVRRFLEETAPRLALRLPSEDEGNNGGTLTLNIGSRFKPNTEMMERLHQNQLVPSVYDRDPGASFLYVPTMDELGVALGTESKAHELFYGANTSDERIAIVSRLLESWSRNPAQARVTAFETISPQRSCLKSCTVIETLDIGEFSANYSNVKVKKVDRFQKGLRLPREFRLSYEDSGLEFAKILMDFSDRPSLIITHEIKQNGQSIFNASKIYDRFLRNLGAVETPIVSNLSQVQSSLQGLSNRPLNPGEVPIASFEADVDLSQERISNALLLGPNFNAYEGNSFNFGGWYPSIQGLTPLSFRGITLNNYDGLFPLYGSPGHSKAVSLALLGDFEISTQSQLAPIRIAPLGQQITMPQTVQAVQLARQVTGNRLRVGSLQHKILLDGATCLSRLSPVFQTGLFLVTAAGNEKRNLEENELCPAVIENNPNLLIVGAGDAGGLSNYSNYSQKLVDIVASGRSPDNSQEGTSFAAPRVAYVSAQLANVFPQATNAELRAALLLSAEFANGPLPVRSGGMLNSNFDLIKYALDIMVNKNSGKRGQIRSRIPFDVATDVMKTVEHNDGRLSDRSQRRLDHLLNSNLICRPVQEDQACAWGDNKCRDLAARATLSCE